MNWKEIAGAAVCRLPGFFCGMHIKAGNKPHGYHVHRYTNPSG